MKNILKGSLLVIYSVAFFLITYISWDLLWQKNKNNTMPEESLPLFVVLAIVGVLTVLTFVIRKIITKKEIEIDFWTFLPIIFYGAIYYYLY